MDVKKVYSKVEDFLKDDEFIRAVLCNSSLSVSCLKELEEKNAGCASVMQEARLILLAEHVYVSALTAEECKTLKEKIFKTLSL